MIGLRVTLRMLVRWTMAAALGFCCCCGVAQADGMGDFVVPRAIQPVKAPFKTPRWKRPTFPDRVFEIAGYGAQAGGDFKNTEAFRAAIDACAGAGGGTVIVPKGVWLTGAIHLKSNVNLRLERDAVLRFSTDPDDYLPVVFTRWAGFECYNYSPLIYARDCTNVALTGAGRIDGQGEAWWSWEERQSATARDLYENQVLRGVPPERRVYGAPEDGLRPQLFSPIGCKNVLLEGITIAAAGPFWTVHFVYCDNVIARGLTISTTGGPNTDGLNVDSSRNVLIEYCRFDTGDDCIALKSGINEDGWRVGRPAENVVIRHIRAQRGHGGIVFGSETSGGLRNVLAYDCRFDGTDVGVRLKSTRGRGGVVENVWIRDLAMGDIRTEAIRVNTDYRAWFSSNGGKAPIFRNIHIQNLSCRRADAAAKITGLPDQPIENLTLENVAVAAQTGLQCEWVRGLRLANVKIQAAKGPPIVTKNCRLADAPAPAPIR